MEKMSRFISIVPNAEMQPPKRRIAPHSSRFRRVRGRRRIVQRVAAPLPPANNESTTVEEISDEVHEDSPLTTTISAEHEPEAPPPPPPPPIVPEPIDDLSRIERVETTMLMDHSSTLMISSTNDTCSTGRRLVLTASSLDDNQKVLHHLSLLSARLIRSPFRLNFVRSSTNSTRRLAPRWTRPPRT